MEKSIKKSATAFGLFASGVITGYTASMLSRNTKTWYPKIQKQVRGFKLPKIAPTIPEFENIQLSSDTDMESHLGLNA